MNTVVFLDVDGVLNTVNTVERAPSGAVGIDDLRVSVLSRAMKENEITGVVLTTTWKDLGNENEDYIYLTETLRKYGIDVTGSIENEDCFGRGQGIVDYLRVHPEIEDFIVLDDQRFDFRRHDKIWERFLDTGGKGLENAFTPSETPSISAMLFLDSIVRMKK